jgi:formylglycine-generating enzyme required for sulfatase activity
MNLTSQYIVNPKSVDTYLTSLATYKSIHHSSAKLRLGDDRQILNDKKKYKIFRVEDIEFKMIHCPRGIFTMGASDLSDNPKRTVSINKPFLLGETEVTQELFEKVMEFNPSWYQGYKYPNSYPNSNKRPVEHLTWYDALMFCNKLSLKLGKRPYYNISNIEHGKQDESKNITKAIVTINPQADGFRLPLEKEWEYAAKAGTNNQFAGTNDPNEVGEVAWCNDNSKINENHQTHPIKGKRPNEWGFYDMSGNAWEWCWDKYDEYSDLRVVRGGCWSTDASFLRSDVRYGFSHRNRNYYTGLRISASLFN